MSYILEALRKAERERSLGQVPSIEIGATKAQEAPRRWWPWLLGAALLVNAGVLAAWLWAPREPVAVPPVAETTAPEPQPTLPAPAVSDYMPLPTTVVDMPVSEPPVVEYTEPVPEPVLVDRQSSPVQVTTEPEFAAPDEAIEASDYETSIEETPVAEAPPLLRDMPADYRRSVPEMKIDAHFHTDVPGRSFVMINLQRYKPGERLSEGPQLVDIIPEGVILSYQGQEFLLTP